jgi:nitrate/nitrite transport system ATP-binding protein
MTVETEVLDLSAVAHPVLSLRGVRKSYTDLKGDETVVLEDLSLDVTDGEFLAILGFSGSGKTTLVSLMAGLTEPDAGEITLRGTPCSGPGRDRGVVFQNYSLMPWLDVAGNVQLAVDAVFTDRSRSERAAIAEEAIGLVGLSHARDRKPAQLSGGMRQRVAVARALSTQPEVLLLDEPLSALDALTRAKLQVEIDRIREQGGRTIVLVTNDVDEALLLADRVAILDQGPGAHIARVYDVDITRPRKRTELNHDPAYQHLRNEIISYLDSINGSKLSLDEQVARRLPALVPVDLDPPPKAVQEAQKSVTDKRFLELFKLKKVYETPEGPLTVVDDINLLMDKGEFVSLIGHSGCGKSTVLTMAAGLNSISGGGIVLDGREITSAGPDKAVVFQAPSLLPWLSARDNVAMGVDQVFPKADTRERADIVEYYLDRVGLGHAMDKKASELSNGMCQRVGLGTGSQVGDHLAGGHGRHLPGRGQVGAPSPPGEEAGGVEVARSRGVDHRGRHDRHVDALTLGGEDHRAPLGAGQACDGAVAAHAPRRLLEVVDLVQRADLGLVGEEDVDAVLDELEELEAVAVDAERVGERERHGGPRLAGGVHGDADRLLGHRCVPEVPLGVDDPS